MSGPGPLLPSATRWRHTLMLFNDTNFISLPQGTLPFKVGECPCKITLWLRFGKLRSWSVWDRVDMGAVRPQDK